MLSEIESHDRLQRCLITLIPKKWYMVSKGGSSFYMRYIKRIDDQDIFVSHDGYIVSFEIKDIGAHFIQRDL